MRRPRWELWDWRSIWKSLLFQPAPVFILLGLLAEPLARAAPWLMRASCEGRPRATLEAACLVVYITVGMPSACAAYYLGFARRRITHAYSRTVADLSFALVLLAGVATLVVLGGSLAKRWSLLQPALAPLRDACWR